MSTSYKEVFIETVFKDGEKFTREQFTALAATIRPTIHLSRKSERDIIKANMSLVSVQQTVNKHLRKFGKILKSGNYYSVFYVVQDKRALKEVARYTRTAANMHRCAAELVQGDSNRQKVLNLKD